MNPLANFRYSLRIGVILFAISTLCTGLKADEDWDAMVLTVDSPAGYFEQSQELIVSSFLGHNQIIGASSIRIYFDEEGVLDGGELLAASDDNFGLAANIMFAGDGWPTDCLNDEGATRVLNTALHNPSLLLYAQNANYIRISLETSWMWMRDGSRAMRRAGLEGLVTPREYYRESEAGLQIRAENTAPDDAPFIFLSFYLDYLGNVVSPQLIVAPAPGHELPPVPQTVDLAFLFEHLRLPIGFRYNQPLVFLMQKPGSVVTRTDASFNIAALQTLDEIDELPRPIDAYEIDPRSRDLRMERDSTDTNPSVTLRFTITKTGETSDIEVVHTTRESLANRAVDRLENITFHPGRREGVAVDVQVENTWSFDGDGELVGPTWQFNTPPVLIRMPDPRWPSSVRRNVIPRGAVIVRFVVNSDGETMDPEITSTTHEAFNRPALNAIAGARFQPACINGEAVASRSSITVRFR